MASQLDWAFDTAIAAYECFGACRAMVLGGGGGTAARTTTIVAAIAEQQWWDHTAGQQLSWISPYVVSPFSLAGLITFAARAYESASTVNVGLRAKLFRVPANPDDDIVNIGTFDRSGEIATSFTNYTWTGTPGAAVPFAVNDRLLFQGFWYPQGGTIAAGTAEVQRSGTNAYVSLTEDVVFSTTRVRPPVQALPRLRERAIL